MTATMTHDSATTESPKIITTSELIARARACSQHEHWGVISSVWMREEILMAAKDEIVPHPPHLLRAIIKSEPILESERAKALYAKRRVELIMRAENCTDSVCWSQLEEGYKTRLILRVSGEKFGPHNIREVIRAVDVIEAKLLRLQEQAFGHSEAALRRIGFDGSNAAVQSHGSKGNRNKRRK